MRLNVLLLRTATDAIWLGRVSYADGLKLQQLYVSKVNDARKAEYGLIQKNYLLLLEHPPVYTVGIRHFKYSDDEEKRLKHLGADFYRTDRGGLITFHGPGQLVAYPIVNFHSLRVKGSDQTSLHVGVRRYVYLIEEVIIRTVHSFNLPDADRSPNTGVWLGGGIRKIAAIGINVRGGITSHGLALNCNTDLSWFHQIVPCGLVGKEVTSLTQELGRNVTIDEVLPIFCGKFAEVFQSEMTMFLPGKLQEREGRFN